MELAITRGQARSAPRIPFFNIFSSFHCQSNYPHVHFNNDTLIDRWRCKVNNQQAIDFIPLIRIGMVRRSSFGINDKNWYAIQINQIK